MPDDPMEMGSDYEITVADLGGGQSPIPMTPDMGGVEGVPTTTVDARGAIEAALGEARRSVG